MAGMMKKAGGFLFYKEPKNLEGGFELLEGVNEEMMDPPDENKPEGGSGQQKKGRLSKKDRQNTDDNGEERHRPPKNPEFLSDKLSDNIETLRQKFHMPRNRDVSIRQFRIGWKLNACLCYIDGMIDKDTLNLSIFPRLMSKEIINEIGRRCPVDVLIENVLTVYRAEKQARVTDIVMGILNGASVLFIDGCDEGVIIDTAGYKTRNVQQPVTEKVVRGSQEGFTEDLRINITLLRRIIKNENLIVETSTVGKADNNTVAILYHDKYANARVVQEVKKRISRIDTDFLPGEGVLEEFIQDKTYALFPQTLSTERPDMSAIFIMEGQIVLLANGTPFALIVPISFFRLLHSPEDGNSRWMFGSFLRIVRALGLFCATFLPGLYVAIVLFHPEVIPTELLISITQAKEPVPFPTVVELLIIEGAFELIREGGIRVPTTIGQTLGIVGAIILGQAAVTAGLVSPIVVIVVSITALGSFTIPNHELGLAIRIERFMFIAAGAILGIYGFALLIFILCVHACSIKSFGVPFLVPVAPKTKAVPEVLIRRPIWQQKNRTDSNQAANRQRQGSNVENWSKE
ncbi:MAG: spore germination protein [Clostridiales bacterium]|nr:spore germination protein [Clostridiales bacterium]